MRRRLPVGAFAPAVIFAVLVLLVVLALVGAGSAAAASATTTTSTPTSTTTSTPTSTTTSTPTTATSTTSTTTTGGATTGGATTTTTTTVVPASAAATPPPQLGVTGASLTVASNGQQLYGDNPNKELQIASTTKLMTALVVLQHVHKLSTIFTQTNWSPQAVDSQIGLVPGEKMSVHDLLLALLLPSADDAAIDLAYNVGGGSIARFVGMMNAEAEKLGLTQTHYENPIGLDSPENYSSPYDLTRLAAYDMSYSAFFRRAVDLQHAVIQSVEGQTYNLANTDYLVGQVPWINGVKTGHTDAAGYILVSSGTRDGLTLTGSVLGTSSEDARDAAGLALLSWGFDEFHQVTAVSEGRILARLPVSDQSLKAVVIAGGGYQGVLPRSDAVKLTLKLPRKLSGPLPWHAVVGEATVLVSGRAVSRFPLLLAHQLPAISPVVLAARFLGRTTTLVVLVLAICAGLAFLALRREAQRRRRRTRTVSRRHRHLEEG
jgi:serine-type D-Ala-D-Ala carboxypeptidase (penicillin-binding protein 5/6)